TRTGRRRRPVPSASRPGGGGPQLASLRHVGRPSPTRPAMLGSLYGEERSTATASKGKSQANAATTDETKAGTLHPAGVAAAWSVGSQLAQVGVSGQLPEAGGLWRMTMTCAGSTPAFSSTSLSSIIPCPVAVPVGLPAPAPSPRRQGLPDQVVRH